MQKQGTIAAIYDLGEVRNLKILMLLAAGAFLLFSNQAFATPVADVLCSVVSMIMLDVGRAIATIAIISFGIAALIGKATWGQGLAVISGIGIMIGAPWLMVNLTTSASAILSTVAAASTSPFSAASSVLSLAGCLR